MIKTRSKSANNSITRMIIFALMVAVIVGAVVGWCLNIYKLATGSFDAITGMLVVRAIGIVMAPLGAIMGYIN